jgi:hypothetical protein
VNSPLFARSPGFLFLTAEAVPGQENVLNNTLTGNGPTVIRGTDPMGAPGGVPVAQPASYFGEEALAKVEGWGASVVRTTVGVLLGLLLVGFGFYLFAKGAES